MTNLTNPDGDAVTQGSPVLAHHVGACLWITLNRPAVLNALNPEMLNALRSAIAEAETDRSTRVVVLRGAGRAFCAGADLSALASSDGHIDLEGARGFIGGAAEAIERLAGMTKPVIAGINGIAAAGGLELALACDFVVAANGAQLGDAHANYGLLPLGGSSVRLPRIVGVGWSKRLMLTGDLFPAEDLVSCGLVDRVIPRSEADTFAKVRHGNRFPFGAGGRWECFPLREFHETDDRKLWQGVSEGLPLWKGESFDQYAPEGAEARWCPDTPDTRKKATTKPRAGAESLIAPNVSGSIRREAVKQEFGRTRLAFRDATNRTNSRTVLACLIPPEVVLVNSAPYLAFVEGGDRERAACLAIMNSLPFDWQARRLVESHVSYFILEGLVVPDLSDEDFDALVHSAARLSCVDERFAEFADSVAVDCGPLDEDERLGLLVDIDARIARAWALSESELQLVYSDFTLDAVSDTYREALASRLRELL